MAGLFNNEIRDFCGETSSISKLSNHFSKDFGLRQEGLNNLGQDVVEQVSTSFKFTDLLNDINEKNTAIDNKVQTTPNTIDPDKILDDIVEYQDIFVPYSDYFVPNISIPSKSTMQFIPPDASQVAEQWAELELSKFDNTSISEIDFNALVEDSSNIRFIDCVRDMAINEEKNDIFYDLDSDLKSMRSKIKPSSIEDIQLIRSQIEKSLQEASILPRQISNEMTFSESNRFLDQAKNFNDESVENINDKFEEIFQIGKTLFNKGQFSEAILAFEAVVQMKPENELGWSYLAMSLSENEQDHRAMIACKKSLNLNKNNREILLSLARIHCNEMDLSSTIACLEQWLLANPKYRDLATVGQETTHSTSSNNLDTEWALESSGTYMIIEEQLNLALNRNQFDIDPELEIAAGTLYHAVQDYDRAILRFEAAVSIEKDNARLLNKLGTTYCNAGHYDKAINAYKKALELAPGFARAQCNMGVACFNTGRFREAIQHAIKAYKIQHVDKAQEMEKDFESDPIWTIIRMSCFKLDRTDLDPLIFKRDIEELVKEFGA